MIISKVKILKILLFLSSLNPEFRIVKKFTFSFFLIITGSTKVKAIIAPNKFGKNIKIITIENEKWIAIIGPKGADKAIDNKNIELDFAIDLEYSFSFPKLFKESYISDSLEPEIKASPNANKVSPTKNIIKLGLLL